MKISLSTTTTTLLLLTTAEAFCPSDRRQTLQQLLGGGCAAAAAFVSFQPPANAGLLDDYGGTDNMSITSKAAAEDKRPATPMAKGESNMEPNLRSNYYYPTNKKRYLPRIKKCNDAIPGAAEAIGSEDWEAATVFATKVADDTILPMKLYTSSLLGGGTNVKVSFAKDMNTAADKFEKAQKNLVKAIAKKDQEKSSAALEELSTALLTYRTVGKLLGPDGGGDIPSIQEIRATTCRQQGRRFQREFLNDRDERMKQAINNNGAVASSTQ